MLETEPATDSLLSQLRRVIKDGIDYLGSVLTLAQARATEIVLSGIVVALLLLAGGLLAAGGFVLLVVALGIWLTHVTGSAGWALLILGGVLGLLAALALLRGMSWLKNLKS
jgi:hypothetical protein